MTCPGSHSATVMLDMMQPTARSYPAIEATSWSFMQFCDDTTTPSSFTSRFRK